MKRIEKAVFQAGKLIKEFPPRWGNYNKKVVFEIARSSECLFEGQILFSRWEMQHAPAIIRKCSNFSIRAGFFDYAVPEDQNLVVWHMNFADPYLFCAYGSPLLAQDELQVAEHPVLGSLYEALVSSGNVPRTVDDNGKPTPVTITGVQRRCSIDTSPNPGEGRPQGLYGNAFARASEKHIVAATRPVSPPTITNILAMAAPSCGDGQYALSEIADILDASFTGFSAACLESSQIGGKKYRTVINTGFWGCGAFGGNRSLMTVLQALAADLADVDIVFWAGQDGLETAQEAYDLYNGIRNSTPSIESILEEIDRFGFQWGESDGN